MRYALLVSFCLATFACSSESSDPLPDAGQPDATAPKLAVSFNPAEATARRLTADGGPDVWRASTLGEYEVVVLEGTGAITVAAKGGGTTPWTTTWTIPDGDKTKGLAGSSTASFEAPGSTPSGNYDLEITATVGATKTTAPLRIVVP
mgnify:CR=1 FL=1